MTEQQAGETNKLSNVYLILVKPQMGENIGAVARVMHNFGIGNLRLVAPRDGWPSVKALAVSAGASVIIENVTIYQNLADAISDLHFVYASTARDRSINKEVITPEVAAHEIRLDISRKFGIIAGPENSGLNNLDISLCNKIITIPVSEEYKSINLAQSLGIICYELYKQQSIPNIKTLSANIASKKELENFLNSLGKELQFKNFFKIAAKNEKLIINLRSIFERISNITSQDIKILHGVVKSLIK